MLPYIDANRSTSRAFAERLDLGHPVRLIITNQRHGRQLNRGTQLARTILHL